MVWIMIDYIQQIEHTLDGGSITLSFLPTLRPVDFQNSRRTISCPVLREVDTGVHVDSPFTIVTV